MIITEQKDICELGPHYLWLLFLAWSHRILAGLLMRIHSKSPKRFPRYGLCNQIGTRLSASKSSRVQGGDKHASALGLHRSSGEHLYWALLISAILADSGFNPWHVQRLLEISLGWQQMIKNTAIISHLTHLRSVCLGLQWGGAVRVTTPQRDICQQLCVRDS